MHQNAKKLCQNANCFDAKCINQSIQSLETDQQSAGDGRPIIHCTHKKLQKGQIKPNWRGVPFVCVIFARSF
jgi:hypothetical protein